MCSPKADTLVCPYTTEIPNEPQGMIITLTPASLPKKGREERAAPFSLLGRRVGDEGRR